MAAPNRGMTVAAATPALNESSAIGTMLSSSSSVRHRGQGDLAESLFADRVGSLSPGIVLAQNGGKPDAAGQLQEQQRAQWREMLAAQSLSDVRDAVSGADTSQETSLLADGEVELRASGDESTAEKQVSVVEKSGASTFLSTGKNPRVGFSDTAHSGSAYVEPRLQNSANISAGLGSELQPTAEKSRTAFSATHSRENAGDTKIAKSTVKPHLSALDGLRETVAPVLPAALPSSNALPLQSPESTKPVVASQTALFSSSSLLSPGNGLQHGTATLSAEDVTAAKTATIPAFLAHAPRLEDRSATVSPASISLGSISPALSSVNSVSKVEDQAKSPGSLASSDDLKLSDAPLGADRSAVPAGPGFSVTTVGTDLRAPSLLAHAASPSVEMQAASLIPGDAKAEPVLSGAFPGSYTGKALQNNVATAKSSDALSSQGVSAAFHAGNMGIEKQASLRGVRETQPGASAVSGAVALSPLVHAPENPVTGSAAAGRGVAEPAAESPFQVMDMRSGEGSSARAALSQSQSAQSASSGLVAGYHDPQTGYVELKAHLGGDGVHASLTAATPEGSAVLEGSMHSLQQWLHERQTPVETLSLFRSTADAGRGHSFSDGAGQGNTSHQNSGGAGAHSSSAERNPPREDTSTGSNQAASLSIASGESLVSGATAIAHLPDIDSSGAASHISAGHVTRGLISVMA